MISGWFGKSRCRELQFDIPIKGPQGLAAAEDEVEVNLGRSDGFTVKWGRDLEATRSGDKEGKFIWYGAISPGEVVLVSKWEIQSQ